MIKNMQCPVCYSGFGAVPGPSYLPQIDRPKYYMCQNCGVKLMMTDNPRIWELKEIATQSNKGDEIMEWLNLEGGAQVFIDTPARKGVCKSCEAEFTWGTTKGNKWMPIVWVDGKAISHFANCPGAGKHRKDTENQTY